MRFIEARFRSLYFAMLASFAMFGVCVTIIGATLPRILDDFQWGYLATGIVLCSGSLGYLVSAFASGMLAHRIGPKRVVVIGLGLQAVGLSLFVTTPNVPLNILLYFLIGVGQGGMEVVVNYAVVRMERGGKSRLMNLMHAAFCVGAVAGPFAVATLMDVWQVVYRLMAVEALVMAGTMALLPFSRLGGDNEEHKDRLRTLQLIRHPLLILSFLILVIYVGTELGTSAWVGEYFETVLGTSPFTAAMMVSIFWFGLLIGRLGLFLGYHGRRQAEVLLILGVICTGGLLFAVLMEGPWLAGAGFFLAGLGYSAIYPLVMALIGKHFKRGQSIAVGFAATGGGIGSFASPFVTGAIAERYGIRRGFVLYIVLNVFMVALICAMIWQTRRRENSEDGRAPDPTT